MFILILHGCTDHGPTNHTSWLYWPWGPTNHTSWLYWPWTYKPYFMAVLTMDLQTILHGCTDHGPTNHTSWLYLQTILHGCTDYGPTNHTSWLYWPWTYKPYFMAVLTMGLQTILHGCTDHGPTNQTVVMRNVRSHHCSTYRCYTVIHYTIQTLRNSVGRGRRFILQ